MDFYQKRIISEDYLQMFSERYNPNIQTTVSGVTSLDVNSNALQIFIGTTLGQVLKLPNATTLLNGHAYIIHNASSQVVNIKYDDNSPYLVMNPGVRIVLFLRDNSTTNGLWIRSVTTSSAFAGTAPILFSYNGNANTGRYMECFPGQSSFDAPFTIASPSTIIGLEFSCVGTGTSTLGVFKLSDLVNPIYSISLVAQSTVIQTDLNIALNTFDQVGLRITGASVNKPRAALYISGS